MSASQGGNCSIALLVNPSSGGGDGPDVEAELRSRGADVHSYETGDAQDPEHWRDTQCGSVVRWCAGCRARLPSTGSRRQAACSPATSYLPDLEPVEGGGKMQFVRSKAGVGDTNVEALYYLAIASAKRSIDLTAAYFVPRPAFIEALAKAAQSDVRIRILVPGPHIDKGFVRVAGRAAYEALLEAGIEIYEYQRTMLHAKTMVVDDTWSSVGTVNFDNRSFQLHDEVTLCVWSEQFAGRLGEAFVNDLEHSDRMQLERWKRRGVRDRVAQGVSKLARREL